MQTADYENGASPTEERNLAEFVYERFEEELAEGARLAEDKRPLADLSLSPRVRRLLYRCGLRTVGQVALIPEDDWPLVRGLGRGLGPKALAEIKSALGGELRQVLTDARYYEMFYELAEARTELHWQRVRRKAAEDRADLLYARLHEIDPDRWPNLKTSDD